MGLFFKTKEEKEARRALEQRIANLDRFPGNLQEYTDFKGQKYIIMNIERPKKYVREHEYSLLSELVKKGCEALIHYKQDPDRSHGPTYPYGVPVKRKID